MVEDFNLLITSLSMYWRGSISLKFVVILKRTFHNCSKILKTCFLITYSFIKWSMYKWIIECIIKGIPRVILHDHLWFHFNQLNSIQWHEYVIFSTFRSENLLRYCYRYVSRTMFTYFTHLSYLYVTMLLYLACMF